MPNYDWREHALEPWWLRYPEWVRGYGLWRDIPGSLSNENIDFEEALRRIAQERHAKPSQRGPARKLPPCVFISHRKEDVDEAEQIAYLACLAGYDYWLDIYDPTLVDYPGAALATLSVARVVALTIEMALLNSTHVIAVVTPQTVGSAWVPYEYGRVKDPVPDSTQAACWLCPTVTLFPEYLHLGEILKSGLAISDWLSRERKRMRIASTPACVWPRNTPAVLI